MISGGKTVGDECDLANRIAKLPDLERERDEAREAFVIATDQMVITQGKLREVNKERDEARDQAHRFRSLNYNHLKIKESASWFPWETSLSLAQKAKLLETEKHTK